MLSGVLLSTANLPSSSTAVLYGALRTSKLSNVYRSDEDPTINKWEACVGGEALKVLAYLPEIACFVVFFFIMLYLVQDRQTYGEPSLENRKNRKKTRAGA